MGEYRVVLSRSLGRVAPRKRKADPAQVHYYKLMLPDEAFAAAMKSAAKDRETERDLWASARDRAFKNYPRWRARAQRGLASLAGRDPN